MSFLFAFLKIITILAFFLSLSDKHLMYRLASAFDVISSPSFNVSMVVWSLPAAAVAVFITCSAASTPMMLSLVPLLRQCGLWYFVHCHISRCIIHPFVL